MKTRSAHNENNSPSADTHLWISHWLDFNLSTFFAFYEFFNSSNPNSEGNQNYNVLADSFKTNEINILDVSIEAMDYGKTV